MSAAGPGLRQRGLKGWRALERLFDAAFGPALDPLRHLGAIGFLALWLLAASGTLLFVFFDTSAGQAYRSVAALYAWPLGLGRLLRGLHRYAADLLVVALALHLLREWLHGHERGARRFTWLTGVPLVAFVFVSAIGGFWLNWDQLGQYSAIASAEWVDGLPLFSSPLARNFLGTEAVSDRLFALFIFVHIGMPLLLLFGLWFHVQRLTRAAVLPPRALALGTLAVLALLALAVPVRSHAPAALDTVPAVLRLDWIVLFWHPLTDATSPAFVWALVGAFALLLFGLPFLPQPARSAVAVVDPAHCNGCRRCFADCPYAAVTMVPHPNPRIAQGLAMVDVDLCTGCGICAGACPSTTPSRSAAELVTAIDLPQRSIVALRRQLQAALRAAPAGPAIVVFGCDHGANCASLADAGTLSFSLICAGQLPPSFVECALRDGAAGVLVATCGEGGCEFRFGARIARERLSGQRAPRLRAGVAAECIEFAFAGPAGEAQLHAALERLRQRVQPALPAAAPPLRHA